MLARLGLVCVLAAVAAGCGSARAHRDPPRDPAPAAVASACASRLPLDTLLDVPHGGPRPRPLILALHGAGQGGYGMQRYTGLSGDAGEFVVAYPNTPHGNGFWKVQDVPRLLALADAIGRCTPITTITAVGFSNGGLMANALACQSADRVRAVALIASGYLGLGRCSPSRPVSVLDVHGSDDQVVPYRGLRAFVGTWARRDGCAPVPSAIKDTEWITHLRWRDCSDGARVEHLRVADDTHGWPSIVDANERIVRFLRASAG